MSTDLPDLIEKRQPTAEVLAPDGPASFDTSGSLATQQVQQMVAAWRRGERPLAENFLACHPELTEPTGDQPAEYRPGEPRTPSREDIRGVVHTQVVPAYPD
jgi:hypothetical protein